MTSPAPFLRNLRWVPAIEATTVGWLTTAQMREVDRIMIDELGIELIQMMENAGRNMARLVIDGWAPATVTVLAGTGGNGGGGLVAARHMANAGLSVSVVPTRAAQAFEGAARHELDILRRIGVDIVGAPPPADVVIDALIGYSLDGPPRGRAAELITAARNVAPTIVALDTPSGLDTTTGEAPGVAVTADATLTLALPKIGLRAAGEVGELFLGDISVPPSVYEAMRVGPPPDFASSPILRISR